MRQLYQFYLTTKIIKIAVIRRTKTGLIQLLRAVLWIGLLRNHIPHHIGTNKRCGVVWCRSLVYDYLHGTPQ